MTEEVENKPPVESTSQVEASQPATDEPPSDDMSPEMSPEELAEAQRYNGISLRCTLIDMGLDLLVLTFAAVAFGPWLDARLAELGWGEPSSVLRVLGVVGGVTLLHVLVSLPLSFYGGYLVEHQFGLSTQTLGKWLISWLKKSVLAVLMIAGLYVSLYGIIWTTGTYWWLVGAGAFFLLSVVAGQLMPLMLPMFYKVEKIDDEALDERFDKLTGGTGLNIDGVYRLGLSAETTKANAMLAGLGSTRRVLMGDTLLDQFSADEIDVIFAHEVGHHVHRHIPKLLAFGAAVALGGFGLSHLALTQWTGLADPALWPATSAPKLMLVMTLFMMAVGPLQGMVSRHFERQADRYALDRTKDPASYRTAFRRLARLNKADPDPHPIEVALLHSHPPIKERLAMADAVS